MGEGLIRNLAFTRQRADFSGLRFGSITPTDIDGLIEFGGRCCVFMETKHGDADLPFGQRLALERVCDAWGAKGIVLVMRNSVKLEAPTYDIAALPVVEYRHDGKWLTTSGARPCVEWIERFASKLVGDDWAKKYSAKKEAVPPDDPWVADYTKHESGFR